MTDTVASLHWRRRRDVTFAISFYNDVIRESRKAGDYEFAASVEDTLNKMAQAYGLPRLDLVGEMLRDELIPSDEASPSGHMFGESGNGRGRAAAELFGGPAAGPSRVPAPADPSLEIYDFPADEDPDEDDRPNEPDDEPPLPRIPEDGGGIPETPGSDDSDLGLETSR